MVLRGNNPSSCLSSDFLRDNGKMKIFIPDCVVSPNATVSVVLLRSNNGPDNYYRCCLQRSPSCVFCDKEDINKLLAEVHFVVWSSKSTNNSTSLSIQVAASWTSNFFKTKHYKSTVCMLFPDINTHVYTIRSYTRYVKFPKWVRMEEQDWPPTNSKFQERGISSAIKSQNRVGEGTEKVSKKDKISQNLLYLEKRYLFIKLFHILPCCECSSSSSPYRHFLEANSLLYLVQID